MKKIPSNPRILIITPEVTYLPNDMGNIANYLSAKAGGLADVSAALVNALFDEGAHGFLVVLGLAEVHLTGPLWPLRYHGFGNRDLLLRPLDATALHHAEKLQSRALSRASTDPNPFDVADRALELDFIEVIAAEPL